MLRVLVFLTLAAVSAAACAQLVVAHSATGTGRITAYELRPNQGIVLPLWTEIGATGLAADDQGRRIFISSGSELLVWPYGAREPEYVGRFRLGEGYVVMSGLAWLQGKLYGSVAGGYNGIYEIHPITLQATLVVPASEDMDLGGLEADPSTGKLYACNDADSDAWPRGLYEIKTNGPLGLASYPTFIGAGGPPANDVDGLAVYAGTAYFVIDQPGEVGRLDLATHQEQTPLKNPFQRTALFSGGTWAPGLVTYLGDADRNGIVDLDDYFALADAFRTQEGQTSYDPRCDFDASGAIDLDDYFILAENYRKS